MTYFKFKRELFSIISGQEEAQGKQVYLLERGYLSKPGQVQNFIKYINSTCFHVGDTILRDDYIFIKWGDGGINETIHFKVKDYFDRYRRENWQGVLPEILFRLKEICRENCDTERNCFVVKAVHYEQNKSILADKLYQKHNNIAIILHRMLENGETEYVTMPIALNVMQKWKMNSDSLIKYALSNTLFKKPPRLYHILDPNCPNGKMFCNHQSGIFMPDGNYPSSLPKDHFEASCLRGYRLTTTKWSGGVLALYYPGVRERLSEIIGCDYYVDVTNLNEALVYPSNSRNIHEILSNRHGYTLNQSSGIMKMRQLYRYCRKRMEFVEI